ncbi:MAG TPA: hypothetical protein VL117_13575 [Thermoleophilia bacterium]|nr:hypothetical protein [Thermoleophilia bacterium]
MNRSSRLALLSGSLLAVALIMLVAAGTAAAAAKHTQRVDVSSAGAQADQGVYSNPPALSANGRYVAFASDATDLVPGDTNGHTDVFVRDLKLHTTSLVSVGPGGIQGNADSYQTAISANGRYVAFDSDASNLVGGDTNGFSDVFVRDRKLHKTYIVSVATGGALGNGASGDPSISPNGRWVGFDSLASNLVGTATNGVQNSFLRDRKLRTTSIVSVGPAGAGNSDSTLPVISANGRWVAFYSDASNLVPHDVNGVSDVFLRDRKTHKTSILSVNSAGVQGNADSYWPSISANGRWVAFATDATNLQGKGIGQYTQVVVRDRKIHKTSLVSLDSGGARGEGDSDLPEISANGRWVAFQSLAILVSRDGNTAHDIYLRDRTKHRTVLVSVSSAGVQGIGDSVLAGISADGRYVGFQSDAANLVPNDTNGLRDVFVRWPLH